MRGFVIALLTTCAASAFAAESTPRIPTNYADCIAAPRSVHIPSQLYEQLCVEKYIRGPARVQARERAKAAESGAFRRAGQALGLLPAPQHECGKGDVVIEVISTECPRLIPREELTHIEGRIYRRDPDGVECDRDEEWFSDWPECGGRPID